VLSTRSLRVGAATPLEKRPSKKPRPQAERPQAERPQAERPQAERPQAERRSQAERRTVTRGALLDAALAQLVESGLSTFTTTEVAKRSGLSQGALFKHFSTKAELLAAVAEYLFDQLRDRFERAYARRGDARRSVDEGLELLWEQMFDARLAAAFELYTAARTDRELRARLGPVVRAHVERIEAFVGTLGDLGDPTRVRVVTGLAIAAIQGLVLSQMALPDPAQKAQLRLALGALAPLLLGEGSLLPSPDRPRSRRTRHA
jgi:AcrR family transcriptional regulator